MSVCLDGPSRRILSEPIEPAVYPPQPSEPEPHVETREPEREAEPARPS